MSLKKIILFLSMAILLTCSLYYSKDSDQVITSFSWGNKELKKAIIVPILVNGNKHNVQLDTGAPAGFYLRKNTPSKLNQETITFNLAGKEFKDIKVKKSNSVGN